MLVSVLASTITVHSVPMKFAADGLTLEVSVFIVGRTATPLLSAMARFTTSTTFVVVNVVMPPELIELRMIDESVLAPLLRGVARDSSRLNEMPHRVLPHREIALSDSLLFLVAHRAEETEAFRLRDE